MKLLGKILLAFLVLLLMLPVSSCNRLFKTHQYSAISCDAEHLTKNKKSFVSQNNSEYLFSGGVSQTDKEAHSGKYSVLTTKKHPFVFSITLKNVGPDEFFKVAVWRKSTKAGNKNGALIVSDKTAKKLYKTAEKPLEIDKNGWEKLEVDFFTPPNFISEDVKIYCWIVKGDSVYFDDIKIVNTKKKYPVYKEEPLIIVLDTSGYKKFLRKRIKAFNAGVLQTERNDWVKGILFGDNKMMKAKLRLKGDWLDHLIGDKWSFRIKMRKNYAWKRLRVFSIQTPFARGYLYEWYAHQLYTNRDILTTRYGFIPVLMGEESKGLYAWEEHFTKQLVEFRQRREGPILKFSEEAFWQVQRVAKNTGRWPDLPFYNCSVIEPFSEGKTLKSPVLYREFLIAARLLNQYKYKKGKPADVFDLPRLAKYFAMLDITHARHGMAWHNQRFYYNPVICKLEPIAYDGFTDHVEIDFSIKDNMAWQILSGKSDIPENYNFFYLFQDTAFLKLYLNCLKDYSSREFVNMIEPQLKPNAVYYDSLIRMEFPLAKFDQQFLSKSTRAVRKYLPRLEKFIAEEIANNSLHANVTSEDNTDTTTILDTPSFYVTAYLENSYQDSMIVGVHNFFGRRIKLLGTGTHKRFIQNFFQEPVFINAYVKGDNGVMKQIASEPGATYLFFQVAGADNLYSVAINPWPYPRGLTPQQELMLYADFRNSPALDTVINNTIFIKKGLTTLSTYLIIPKGYKVIIKSGTHINLIKHAMFISYSPVFMRGAVDDSVVISSSDGTGNGFTVLQAEGRSVMEYVRFKNMNTLNYNGWTLSGSVTFYESDVDINHVDFVNNRCEDALNIIRSDFTLKNSRFSETRSDAFDSDFSNGLVDGVLFTKVGNDAIDFSGSRITIVNCKINGVQDKGVSGGENSHLIVKSTTINHANIGLASKDLSSLKVSNCYVDNCKYGVVLLQKKPEYGAATMQLNKVKINNTETRMLIEKGSKVVFDGKTIKGDKKKVAAMFY